MRRQYKATLSVLLAFMAIGASWAFQPGPDIIRECPKCQARLVQETTASGNTMGATFWTDGKMDASMLPSRPLLVKCPKCGALLWIDEITKLGEQWKTYYGYPDEGREWTNSVATLLPSEAEYLSLLAEGALPDKKERHLRFQVWWAANDPARNDQGVFEGFSPAQEKNLAALLDLMDETDPDQRLTKAEILRELKRFDECIKLLEKPFDDEDYATQAEFIRLMAEQKKWIVLKIIFDKSIERLPAVHKAARIGDLAGLKTIVEAGGDLESKDASGWSPLVRAAYEGHLDIVKYLLDTGVDAKSTDGTSALFWAASEGRLGAVKSLVEAGADMNTQVGDYGQTPLAEAVGNNKNDVASYLVEKGADVNLWDKEKWWSPLMSAASRLDLVKLLVSHGADVNARNESGHTPLSRAVQGQRLEVVKYLMGEGADKDINAADADGMTPLMWARRDIAEYLLENGADVNARKNDGSTTLMMAVKEGEIDFAKHLLRYGADINARNNEGETPLMKAFWREQHSDMVQWLVANGADVNASRPDGQTPLMYAAQGGEVFDVEFLIESGANVNATNNRGDNALRFSMKSTAKALKEHGIVEPRGYFELPDGYDHEMQDGDTIEAIARLHWVSPEDIRSANRIPEGEQLPAGALVRIPDKNDD